MSPRTETTEKTGADFLEAAISKMGLGSNIPEQEVLDKLRRRRGPSTKTVKVPRLTLAEKAAAERERVAAKEAAAAAEKAALYAGRQPKPKSKYLGEVTSTEHGAVRIFIPYFNAEALVCTHLAAAISADAELQEGDEVRVRIEEKDGSPRFKVTQFFFNNQSWSLDEVMADAKLKASAAAFKDKQRQEAEAQAAAEETKSGFVIGTLKFFNLKKRFGFVTSEAGNDDYLHISTVERVLGDVKKLPDNARLSYKRGKGPSGRSQITAFKIIG